MESHKSRTLKRTVLCFYEESIFFVRLLLLFVFVFFIFLRLLLLFFLSHLLLLSVLLTLRFVTFIKRLFCWFANDNDNKMMPTTAAQTMTSTQFVMFCSILGYYLIAIPVNTPVHSMRAREWERTLNYIVGPFIVLSSCEMK